MICSRATMATASCWWATTPTSPSSLRDLTGANVAMAKGGAARIDLPSGELRWLRGRAPYDSLGSRLMAEAI